MNQIKTSQDLPCTIVQAWEFLSSPQNLKRITPAYMGFDILSGGDQAMYPGMIIQYTVKPLFRIPLRWISEITHIREPFNFIDEQRVGPYAFWRHEHFLREIPGGVEMIDVVDYELPLGPVGFMIDRLLVGQRLRAIFKYRREKLEEIFGKM